MHFLMEVQEQPADPQITGEIYDSTVNPLLLKIPQFHHLSLFIGNSLFTFYILAQITP